MPRVTRVHVWKAAREGQLMFGSLFVVAQRSRGFHGPRMSSEWKDAWVLLTQKQIHGRVPQRLEAPSSGLFVEVDHAVSDTPAMRWC